MHTRIGRTATRIEGETLGFDILHCAGPRPECLCLFAVGRGGNPERHLGLIQSLAERGVLVIAPYFEMIPAQAPSKADLDLRIARLDAALMHWHRGSLPIVGLGHSIGATALLALAGGKGETRSGETLFSGCGRSFDRLALLAPATGFFRRPGALRDVNVSIHAWVGEKDQITPPDQSLFLKAAVGDRDLVTITLDRDAGHFTFMDVLPPSLEDPHPNRDTFLAKLAADVGAFLVPRLSKR